MSSTFLTVKSVSPDELASMISKELGETTCLMREVLSEKEGDEVSGRFAIGAFNGFSIALAPGYKNDSQLLFDILAPNREVGSFHHDSSCDSASVVIYEGFEPSHRWMVDEGRLVEDISGHFDCEGVSPEWVNPKELDLDVSNHLYTYIGGDPDEVEVKLAN